MTSRGDGGVETLVDEALGLLERGRQAAALAKAEAACALDPRHVPALHARAAALAELGRRGDAVAAYDEALARGPKDLEVLAGATDFLVNGGAGADDSELSRALELSRRGARLARKTGDCERLADFLALEGTALNELGRSSDALPALEAALAIRPGDENAAAEHAFALFETCRFEEARRELLAVLEHDDENAWAHHTLGLIAERMHDPGEARRRFDAARRYAPEDYPVPVELSPAAFDAAVEAALVALPPPVRDYLSNVAIAVEDIPAIEDLMTADPPLSPSVLGMFRGSPLGEKASMDPWSHFPSSIVLYRNNLRRLARDRSELLEEIRVTLVHEVGHFLGLSEEDLWARGLD